MRSNKAINLCSSRENPFNYLSDRLTCQQPMNATRSCRRRSTRLAPGKQITRDFTSNRIFMQTKALQDHSSQPNQPNEQPTTNRGMVLMVVRPWLRARLSNAYVSEQTSTISLLLLLLMARTCTTPPTAKSNNVRQMMVMNIFGPTTSSSSVRCQH